jgi:hypothetical protein
MIPFKRGKSDTWRAQETPLADGQPGFDKDRQKLKIGNGKDSWDKLPNVSGLRLEEILESEEKAKKTLAAKTFLNPVGAFLAKALKLDDRPVITYGTDVPDDGTLGQIYLQHYETAPEVDYVVASGSDGIWEYLVYNSGKVRCWGTYYVETAVQNRVGNGAAFISTAIGQIAYPSHFTFKEAPTENATIIPASGKASWLISTTGCSVSKSGKYHIASFDKHEQAKFGVAFEVNGKIQKN